MTRPSSRLVNVSPPVPVSSLLRERDARLEAIKAALGRLGHDFNNSLVPILGFITLIKEEISPESLAREYADSIEIAGRRTEQMIETLLLATRPQRRYSPKRIDFKSLVEEEIALMEQETSKPGLIFSTGEMEACFLMADPAQWRKVIRAVLQNALQATAPAGTIETRLQSMTLPVAQAADLGVAAVDVIRWEVKDRGPGMSAEMLGRAFEPFFSTRAKKESLGLGLTIAHSVTRLHGGQIELHSGEGAGTTVTIWLPKVAPEK